MKPFSHNWLIKHTLIKEIQRLIKTHAQGELLDIGCGEKPYEAFANQYVKKYVGVDHELTPHDKTRIDFFSDAYQMPFPEARFDTILCTEVLEHLEEPKQALTESCRVLKPGGLAIYTVPFAWHIHESPRDFYRYTYYGLQYLFTQAGFEIVEIRSLNGFVERTIQSTVYYVWRFRKGGMLNPFWWLIPPVTGFMQGFGILFNTYLFKNKNSSFTDHYSVVARRV